MLQSSGHSPHSPSPSEGHSSSWGAGRALSLPISPRAGGSPWHEEMEVSETAGLVVLGPGDPHHRLTAPSMSAPLRRPAQESWPGDRAACPEQVPAERGFSFSWIPPCRHTNAALLFSRVIPALQRAFPHVSVSVLAWPAVPASLSMLGPKLAVHSAEQGGCGALWPRGEPALAMLVGVGSRPSQKGITAAEPLSIFP